MENEHSNDNEELTFSKLGLAAALILNRIRNADSVRELSKLAEENKENAERDTGCSANDEKCADDKRAYVEKRLAETAKWERRISGK